MSDAAYQVRLDVFEGPLDLLLHLVKKHELDILDIPISFVTERYLEYLDAMSMLDIDVAGEYLVIAISDANATAWQDPAFLEASAAQASRVRLAWGQSISTSLRLSR